MLKNTVDRVKGTQSIERTDAKILEWSLNWFKYSDASNFNSAFAGNVICSVRFVFGYSEPSV